MLVVAIAVSAAFHLSAPILPEDDAFITFRYVRNAAAGRGWVYNDDQRVCGVTAPFYLLVLTGLSRVLPATPIHVLAVRGNVVPLVAVGVLMYLLIRRWTGRAGLAAIAAAVMLLSGQTIERSTDGMESLLFAALLLATLWAMMGEHAVLSGIGAGLAALTRPEGLVLVPLVAWAFRRSGRNLLKAGGACAVLTLPWVVFAWMYYGSPIPHSIIAKSRPLYPVPPGFALRQLVSYFGMVWVALVVAATALAVLLPSRRREFLARVPNAWAPFAAHWLIVALYAVGNPFMFAWYYPPLRVLGLFTIFCAVAMLLGPADHQALGANVAGGRTPRVPEAVIGLLAIFYVLYSHRDGLPAERIQAADRLRIRAYQEAAEVLKEKVRPGQRVAAAEVGALGYWYGGPLLDACGLVSPEAIPYLPVPPNERVAADVGAVPLRLIEDVRPEWVVSMPYFVRKGLAASPWFKQAYELAATAPLPKPLWGDRAVLIYKKR